MTTKHLYENNVTEWYVAESLEEAIVIAEKYQRDAGMDPSEFDLDLCQTPDDHPLGVE